MMFKVIFVLFLNIQLFGARFIEFDTEQGGLYKHFYPNSLGFVNFRVKANTSAYISLLTNDLLSDPMYTIILGGYGNTKSVFRKNLGSKDLGWYDSKTILNNSEYKDFWMSWKNGTISVGSDGNTTPFLKYMDTEVIPILYIGFASLFSASWVLETTHHWVPNTQSMRNQVSGGQETRAVFVARAEIENSLIPGKLLAGYDAWFVAPNGTEVKMDKFEALSDLVGGYWIHTNGSNIPCNAIEGGYTDKGEILYIGRAVYKSFLVVGKVVPSAGKLFVGLSEVIAFDSYAILVQD